LDLRLFIIGQPRRITSGVPVQAVVVILLVVLLLGIGWEKNDHSGKEE
jgi:hypothetical protein